MCTFVALNSVSALIANCQWTLNSNYSLSCELFPGHCSFYGGIYNTLYRLKLAMSLNHYTISAIQHCRKCSFCTLALKRDGPAECRTLLRSKNLAGSAEDDCRA